jgi:hypothetical protein
MFRQARSDSAKVQGTPAAWVTFKRMTHHARVIDAQEQQIHKIYLISGTDVICTCGLQIPQKVAEPFLVAGHLDMQNWEPTTLLLAEPHPRSAVVDRRYAVVCQVCSMIGPEFPFDEAQRQLEHHHHWIGEADMPTDRILTIRRRDLNGNESRISLVRPPGLFGFVVEHPDGTFVGIDAATTLQAVRESDELRLVDGNLETHIEILDHAALVRDDLLDALEPTADALEPEDWEEAGDRRFWPLEDTCSQWSTAHRVSIAGTPVFGVDTESGVVLVPADNPEDPEESWTELIAVSWDSSDYAAVGMAGSGFDGLYLVRPGVLARVSYVDGQYDIQLEAVHRSLTPLELVLPRLTDVFQTDALLALLDPAAAGEDVRSGDTVSTQLRNSDITEIIRALKGE